MSETPTSSPPGTRWGLKTKLILSMLLVGVVPLVVGLGMAFWQGSQEIRDVSGESFKALATEAARKLDLLVAEEIAHTARIANDPTMIRELERRRDAPRDRNPKSLTTGFAELERSWTAREPAAVKAVVENPLSVLLREYYTGVHSAPGQLPPQVARASTKMLFLTDAQGTLVATMSTKPNFATRTRDGGRARSTRPWANSILNTSILTTTRTHTYSPSRCLSWIASGTKSSESFTG
jgi:hypothetical protein